MRYELSDYEWAAIKPFLPSKPRGVPRVNDRRVLDGIFWVLRSGAPWRDLPASFGPHTTCYNRFVRWRRAGVWDQLMQALTAGHDVAVQNRTSIVRVHQHGACIAGNNKQLIGRSRGGLTTKIYAVVDTRGVPIRLALKRRADFSKPRRFWPLAQAIDDLLVQGEKPRILGAAGPGQIDFENLRDLGRAASQHDHAVGEEGRFKHVVRDQ